MKNREKLLASSGADAFVSIHMNLFSDSKYSGPQVFYSKNHKKSENLAKSIQNSMIQSLHPVMERECKKADDGIYLLKKAKLPAVLVECGFISNPEEQQKLINENYRKEVAWAIYCGIIQYFQET